MMEAQPEGLADRIFRAAAAYASQQGYELGHGAEADFRAAARRAAKRLEPLSDDKREKALLEMDATFRTVIDHMIIEAKTIPGYEILHPGIIGEETLRSALLALCPLFPFC